MGICSSCFGSEDSYKPNETLKPEYQPTQPAPEERRQQMLAAAEKRQKEQESKGLYNPERVKAKQMRMEELEMKQKQMGGYQSEGGGLRWQVS